MKNTRSLKLTVISALLAMALFSSTASLIGQNQDCTALKLREFCVVTVTNGDIKSIAFSPDGTKIAYVGEYFRATILSVPSGSVDKQSLDNNEFGNTLAFSPNGNMLAIGGDEGISFWNLITDERSFVPTDSVVTTLSFAPSGSEIVYGQSDGMLHVLRVTTGEVVLSAQDNNFPFGASIVGIDYSADGNYIGTNSVAGSRIWNAQDLTLAHTLVGNLNFPLGNIDFAPTGMKVAHGEKLPSVPVWEIGADNRYQLVNRFPTLANGDLGASSASFSPDARRIAIGAFDYEHGSPAVRVWNVTSGEMALELLGIGRSTENVTFSGGSGAYVAASSNNSESAPTNHLLLWRVQ